MFSTATLNSRSFVSFSKKSVDISKLSCVFLFKKHDYLKKRLISFHSDTTINHEKRIFCNRELAMHSVKAVGFDMDYTLALYYPTFDKLAYEGAKKKLVEQKGYSIDVLNLIYQPNIFQRGLVIDKERGNFLKLDRHKYVQVAYHGFKEIHSEERKNMYHEPCSYTDKQYINMDTQFLWTDALLFAQLVEQKDSNPLNFKAQSYKDIFQDVREAVDLCHRDGTIKDTVSKNPAEYIDPEPGMASMLKILKNEGFKVFLVTNSEWEYTNVVMNHLYGNSTSETRSKEWIDLFDVVFCLASKPKFLTNERRAVFRVNTATGKLRWVNTFGTSPDEMLKKGKVFQKGNWKALQTLLSITRGEEILYFGDHLYADVLRSKRTLGWRTGMVVPELQNEMERHLDPEVRALNIEIESLREQQTVLEELFDATNNELQTEQDSKKRNKLNRILKDCEAKKKEVKEKLRQKANESHKQFHPIWGQNFKTGYQNSRFAHQITDYACLYTSKASNLGQISKKRIFRASNDTLPHDRILNRGTSPHSS